MKKIIATYQKMRRPVEDIRIRLLFVIIAVAGLLKSFELFSGRPIYSSLVALSSLGFLYMAITKKGI